MYEVCQLITLYKNFRTIRTSSEQTGLTTFGLLGKLPSMWDAKNSGSSWPLYDDTVPWAALFICWSDSLDVWVDFGRLLWPVLFHAYNAEQLLVHDGNRVRVQLPFATLAFQTLLVVLLTTWKWTNEKINRRICISIKYDILTLGRSRNFCTCRITFSLIDYLATLRTPFSLHSSYLDFKDFRG